MLRIRRDLILSFLPQHFLLEPGVNSLRTVPFTEDSLFGGSIKAAITVYGEDQIFSSLKMEKQSCQSQGAFKRPASKPPTSPTAKNAKKSIFLLKMAFSIPHPAPHRPSFYTGRLPKNLSGRILKICLVGLLENGKPKPDQKTFKPSTS
ncbi:hypothetical protein DPMN_079990 [Dreissena polymorpha]|uniref:Uncharacterized protein n=1 Tax=Dreissena polymorpha TaxID=45954 RepID=A0A9D4BQL1_DREPO|nr:hypothetical protein DPMN_079990 [Dreissena polymorpha]